MTAKAAICMALLRGDVISIRSGFRDLGVTNLPREIGRSIERYFKVEVSKTHREGKSRWKVPCTWVEYRLNFTEYNKPGIEKMKEYCRKNCPEFENIPPPKQSKQTSLPLI